MTSKLDAVRAAEMVAPADGEKVRSRAMTLLGTVTDLVEVLPVSAGADLAPALGQLHRTRAAVLAIPLTPEDT